MTPFAPRRVHRIEDLGALDEALARERALIYKHSTRCGLSTLARRQIDKFTEEFPGADVYVVDVIAARPVSEAIETRLGIRHETPQAILVEGGKARHHASHRGVRASALADWWKESIGSG